MRSVIGIKLKYSGRATPTDCRNNIPRITANPAIKLLPKIQLPKSSLSSKGKRYGNAITAKSVIPTMNVSSEKEPKILPNSIAKKNNTNDVSTLKVSFPFIKPASLIISVIKLYPILYEIRTISIISNKKHELCQTSYFFELLLNCE